MAIKKIGKDKWRVDHNPGRKEDRTRKVVAGNRQTAQAVYDKLVEQHTAKKFGLRQPCTATVAEVVALVVQDYRDNRRKSLQDAIEICAMWADLCGDMIADDVHEDMLKDWAREWMIDGLAPATCNRRVSKLLRGFRLAKRRRQPMVNTIPYWKDLKEAPPRSGYREWHEFLAIRNEIAFHARVPITVEYWTGMRSGEVHGLRWNQIRFDHIKKMVHFLLPDTKAGYPRWVGMKGDLYRQLSVWHEYTMKNFPDCTHLCHMNGEPIESVRTAWMTACVKVGLGVWTRPEQKDIGKRGYRGAIPHDFRRTAVRNMDNAGIPRKVAMSITGHETESTYRRYRIVSEREQISACDMLLADHEQRNGSQPVVISVPKPPKTPRKQRGSGDQAAVL